MKRNSLDRITDAIVNSTESNAKKDPSAQPVEGRKSTGMTAPGALASFSKDFKDIEAELIRLKATQGLPAMLPISQLHSSPYQTRRIDEQKVSELIANLTANPLSTPVAVRKKGDGEYEIVAGHHRILAYKRMGRTEIPASVVVISEEEAQKLVFYDNLLAPQLTDFEKYIGFSKMKKTRGVSTEQLSIEAGVSKSLVVYIMSFERLPQGVLNKLEQHPGAIGANLAVKLCALPASSEDRINQAIEMIDDGRLNQSKALAWIEQKEKPVKKELITIKSGRYKFADVSRREGQLTIKFANLEDASDLEKEIVELLRKHSALDKSDSNKAS